MNVELIKATVAYIEQHPEEWDQETYGVAPEPNRRSGKYVADGPKRCFFGHALLLGEADYHTTYYTTFSWRSQTSVFTDARELLGLRFEQAYEISEFRTNNVNELKAKITEQTGIEF